MRRWGVVVSIFYAVVLVLFVMPGMDFLLGGDSGLSVKTLFDFEYLDVDDGWIWWAWILALVAGEILLLAVSVDTSRKKLLPRRHVAYSGAAITIAVGLLSCAAFWSILVLYGGDDALEYSFAWLLTPITFWVVWGIVFALYAEGISARMDKALNWLIAGSVLELLIVVPCHVLVRQRNECSAPGVTALGIATGIAVMLMAFGPSVLFLYRKRLRMYEKTTPESNA